MVFIDENPFSTFEIVKALEIKRVTLQDWLARGFIKPSVDEAKGKGTKNLFNIEDVYRIRLFDFLINRGVPREQAAKQTWAFSFSKLYENDFRNSGQSDRVKYFSTLDVKKVTRPTFFKVTKKGGVYSGSFIFRDEIIEIQADSEIEEINILNLANMMDDVDNALLALKK